MCHQVVSLGFVSALCLCGSDCFIGSKGRSLVFLGEFVLWAFAAYAVRVAGVLGKRGRDGAEEKPPANER